MEWPAWLKIENIIGKIDLSNWFKGAFKRENSPVDKRRINNTINAAEIKITQNIVVAPKGLPGLFDKDGGSSMEKLRESSMTLLADGLGDSLLTANTEKDRETVNKRIDETVAFIKLNRYNDALPLLLTILGEIRNNPNLVQEQTRVYNNLGVVYNRPKPDGDYDKAIEYFNAALEKDPAFVKSKMNLAAALLSKDSKESIQKGSDLIKVLWTSEKTHEVLQVLLWGIYKTQGAKEVFGFIESEKANTESLIKEKAGLSNILALCSLELGKADEALEYAEQAVGISPDEPEFVAMKARALMLKTQQNSEIPTEFEVIPKLKDYNDVSKALELFTEAERLAETQNKSYLLSEIRYGISISLTWLGRFDESKYKLQQLQNVSDLPELLAHQVNVLNFAALLQNREFETAYHTLVKGESYSKIDYREKRRIARVFLVNGAPEQAKLLLDEVAVEAEQRGDIYYWFDLSTVSVLLGNHQEAISAATKVKKLSEGKDEELRKTALSHYNAVNFHYSTHDNGENSETDRLVLGMMDFQKEFPEEKILTPVQVMDEKGGLTTEMKDMLTSMKGRYETIRDTFKKNPIPIYFLEETFHRSFADLMKYREDPEFTIEFNSMDSVTQEELVTNLKKSDGFVFDYLSLLDLAKMDFLGFLEKLGKPIFIHEALFQKIQEELLRNEIEELRTLWNFLRKSKIVKIIKEKTEVNLKSEKLDGLFEEWLVESIKYAKTKNFAFVTSDFKIYRFLKFEEIIPLNIVPILKSFLDNGQIDKKMFSRALGDLAERFYIFIPYTSDDLFEIVLEDKGKVTLRSYHLVKEIFLPGSNVESFTNVFTGFVHLFWRTGSLSEEKVNWIRFLTNIITKIIDDRFIPLNGKSKNDVDVEAMLKELKPITSHLAMIWKTATQSGTKDDLIALEKIVDEVLNKHYLAKSKDAIRSQILKRIEELTPKQ